MVILSKISDTEFRFSGECDFHSIQTLKREIDGEVWSRTIPIMITKNYDELYKDGMMNSIVVDVFGTMVTFHYYDEYDFSNHVRQNISSLKGNILVTAFELFGYKCYWGKHDCNIGFDGLIYAVKHNRFPVFTSGGIEWQSGGCCLLTFLTFDELLKNNLTTYAKQFYCTFDYRTKSILKLFDSYSSDIEMADRMIAFTELRTSML